VYIPFQPFIEQKISQFEVLVCDSKLPHWDVTIDQQSITEHSGTY